MQGMKSPSLLVPRTALARRQNMLDIILNWDYNDPMKEKLLEAKFNARFPLEVFTALRALAKEHQRSINSELVWLVRQYIERQNKNG
jgi:hypothetical protein